MYKKRILQIILIICILLLIIAGIQFIRSNNSGTPNQEQKGNPFKQPAPKKEPSAKSS
jgi:flagellar basal body-associated protein FliL